MLIRKDGIKIVRKMFVSMVVACFLLLSLVYVESLSEKVDRELIGCHHYGRVWDLSDQLSSKAPVKTPPSLFSVDQPQRLPE